MSMGDTHTEQHVARAESHTWSRFLGRPHTRGDLSLGYTPWVKGLASQGALPLSTWGANQPAMFVCTLQTAKAKTSFFGHPALLAS